MTDPSCSGTTFTSPLRLRNSPWGVTTTTAAAGPNALSMKLSRDPKQLTRVSGMLPEGMTIEQATTGFRNQGQFVAALNASRSQGVAFADLQQAMTVDGLSLGQAVKQLRNAPPAPDAPAAGTGTTTPPTGGTTTGGTTTGGTTTGGTTTGGTTTGGTTTGGTTTGGTTTGGSTTTTTSTAAAKAPRKAL